ncbi:cupin domain-containing protein [Cupriavidus sp. CV2]|uniref:cupin domain-containing protein n=1 Tax=Cupriavidus ulmosensis TaxID=3065913 RepID=UPI00296B33A6|nr:cupin domain-containing protein [Cupriavidus sp. CV2]MDW3686527.1 cupin domain-containing protein [Cupriavidus sp. CV2]
MPLIQFDALAAALPGAWKSTVAGQVGPARIKVLRMDEQAFEAETHDYNEGLLVASGRLMLQVEGEAGTVVVEPGQMYLALAGISHAVLPGSHGTLVIVDV